MRFGWLAFIGGALLVCAAFLAGYLGLCEVARAAYHTGHSGLTPLWSLVRSFLIGAAGFVVLDQAAWVGLRSLSRRARRTAKALADRRAA